MSRIERMNGRAKIALSAGSQTLGNVMVALGAVFVLRITTHQLGPTDYGLFALIVTYVNLFSLIADLGISAMTTRELARVDTDRHSVLSVTLSSRVALSVFVIPIILVSAAILYPTKPSLFHLSLAIMSIDVLFQAIQLTASTAFAVRVRGDLIAMLSVTNRALYLAGVVFAAILHTSYFGYICAYVGADAIVALVALVAARRSISMRWTGDLRRWWRSIADAFPLGIIQLIGNIYTWIDSILLSILRSPIDVGYYSLAFNIVNVLGSIPSFLMQALIPSLVNSNLREVTRIANRAIYVLFCVAAPLAAGGILLRFDIVNVLAGPRFIQAATPLAIVVATLPISFIQTAIGYTSVSIDRYRPLLIVGCTTLLINVGLNLVLIPDHGASGAASALFISEAGSLVATYIVFRRLSAVRVDWLALWRPAIATAAIFILIPVINDLRAHMIPLTTLVVGGAAILGIYLVTLMLVGGVPLEVRGVIRRRSNHRYKHSRRNSQR